jgi:hypothetical protein
VGEYVLLDVKNSDDIRLLGPHYYIDCYTFWDLQRCREAFYGNDYQNVLNCLKGNSINLYNGDGTMAVIDCSKYSDFNEYYSKLSNKTRRNINKSTKRYYSFKEFDFDDFIPDFCDIAQSQLLRKTDLNPWYLKPPSFFMDDRKKVSYWKDHYAKWYGLFRHRKGYTQFDKTTNEKLLAYCQIMVDGEMATIGLIFGHAMYLKYGIMFKLITSVVEELMKDEGIKAIVYYGWGQYPVWKSKMLFEPKQLLLNFS